MIGYSPLGYYRIILPPLDSLVIFFILLPWFSNMCSSSAVRGVSHNDISRFVTHLLLLVLSRTPFLLTPATVDLYSLPVCSESVVCQSAASLSDTWTGQASGLFKLVIVCLSGRGVAENAYRHTAGGN